MRHTADVIVVGGGLAGLTAAAFAARAGTRVRVLERSRELGGRARTRELDGFLLNVGPHALYRKGAGRAVLRELDVPLAGAVPPYAGRALHGGRSLALPVGPTSLATTRLLSARAKLQMVRVLARLQRGAATARAGASLEEWMAEEGLRPDAAALLGTIARVTTYAHDPARLDARAALAQVHLGLTGGVLYLDGGWQTVVRGLHAAAEAAGAEIVSGARVDAVEADASGVRGVRTADGFEAARTVVLAVPPPEAARLAGALAPAVERHAAAAIPVRAACLDLGLRALPRPRDVFALGVDRPWYFSVHTATARLAPGGGALVHAMRYLGADPPPAAELERELEELVDTMQPGWREQVRVRRFVPDLVVAGALVAAPGGLAGRPAVDGTGVAGLLLAGDWVGGEGMLADASLASGRRAGLRAAGGRRAEAAA